MWETLLEACVRIFGLSAHPREFQFRLASGALGGIAIVSLIVWGPRGLLLPAALLALGVGAALQAIAARDAAWRAATLRLDDPRQPPDSSAMVGSLAPTTATLRRLAAALDDARRERYVAANESPPAHRSRPPPRGRGPPPRRRARADLARPRRHAHGRAARPSRRSPPGARSSTRPSAARCSPSPGTSPSACA